MEAAVKGAWHALATFVGLSFCVLMILFNAAGFIVSLLCLPDWRAIAFLATQGALLLVPLDLQHPPRWMLRFIRFTFLRARQYFPIRLVLDDEAAMDPERTYCYGYEPHDVLPLAMFMFLKYAEALPAALCRDLRVLASSACFAAPLLRHYWWLAGVRPVSRQTVSDLLSRRTSCVLCPGGVKECMQAVRDGVTDVAYLRKRTGFVKLAMQHGADIVPVWCFGQRDLYSFLRPFIDWPAGLLPQSVIGAVAGRLGFMPMLIWGVGGTPLPRRVPVTVVVGKPIKLPQVDNPSKQQVEQYLGQYIEALQDLHVRYKGKYANSKLQLSVV